MTNPDTKNTTSPPAGDAAPQGLTAGKLRDLIREEIVKLLPGKGSDAAPSTKDDGDSKGDIKTQVSLALQSLKARESREERDKAVDDMLASYNKKPEETPPVERRRVERWMRWSSGEDD